MQSLREMRCVAWLVALGAEVHGILLFGRNVGPGDLKNPQALT